jgi:uncharacterized membrane protein YdbT with pleckstrin-like domain
VAFPEDVLTSEERVVLHMHPHWKILIRPILVAILAIVLFVLALIFLPDNGFGTVTRYVVGGLALLVVIWLSVKPFLIRQTTHYVFTDQRVLLQYGIFNRDRRDIPLNRVNDHTMNQHFFERLLGTGTLTIESAGERGQTMLVDIPQVEKVQTTLYELVEQNHDRQTLDAGEMREIMDEHREAQRRPPAG